jgi:hypothetical protein
MSPPFCLKHKRRPDKAMHLRLETQHMLMITTKTQWSITNVPAQEK